MWVSGVRMLMAYGLFSYLLSPHGPQVIRLGTGVIHSAGTKIVRVPQAIQDLMVSGTCSRSLGQSVCKGHYFWKRILLPESQSM